MTMQQSFLPSRVGTKEENKTKRLRSGAGRPGSKVPRGCYSIEYLNLTKDQFEWENNNIPTNKVTGEEEPVVHPSLIAKIPGAVLEEDFEDIAEAITESHCPSDEDRGNAARENTGFSYNTGVTSELTGVQYTPSKTVPHAGYTLNYDSDSESNDENLPQEIEPSSDSDNNDNNSDWY